MLIVSIVLAIGSMTLIEHFAKQIAWFFIISYLILLGVLGSVFYLGAQGNVDVSSHVDEL